MAGIKDETMIKERGRRLRAARLAKGFTTVQKVIDRYPSWNLHTFRSHDAGIKAFDDKTAKTYAEAFGVDWRHLMARDFDEDIVVPIRPTIIPTPNASFPPRYQEFSRVHTTPLLGQGVSGPNGRFILNGTELMRVFCPPSLEGVEGAYAVRVYGTSMEPRFKAGETVWVNPWEPIRAGDDVVAQLLIDDDPGQTESYIKEFRSRSPKVLRLLQHNPGEGETEKLEFSGDRVFAVHKIVFHSTL